MEKIKKLLTTKIITLSIAATALFSNLVYPCQSGDMLRIPMGQKTTYYRLSREQIIDNVQRSLVSSGLFTEPLIKYYRAFKRRINPQDGNFTVVYGGAGADISSLLLAAGFTKAYFVNNHPVSCAKLKEILRTWSGVTFSDYFIDYGIVKRDSGVAGTNIIKSGIEALLIHELFCMGVRQIEVNESANSIKFKLLGDTVQREIVFVNADIKDLAGNKTFSSNMKQGIDCYFQKGAEILPREYGEYISEIGEWIRPGGFMMLSNYAIVDKGLMEYYDPMAFIGGSFFEYRC
ncbi:MAG: hypothetical protein KKB22_03050 [Candidatus Omnitrophica bacterium]|nr:hypothetical protein [Candidatus Omnitrophota bacterium]